MCVCVRECETGLAQGYAAHLTMIAAEVLNVPLRYKVKRAGCSRCSIWAKVTAQRQSVCVYTCHIYI